MSDRHQQWEYLQTDIGGRGERCNSRQLCNLGLQGWELVHVSHWYGTASAIFKRPLLRPKLQEPAVVNPDE